MIYLIGGASRSGKTSLALRLLEEKGAPYLSTDALMMGLRGAGYSAYANQVDDLEVARELEKILAPMIENLRYCGVPYALEGVHLRPAFIREMMDVGNGEVKGCILGYPDVLVEQKVADMLHYPSTVNNWLKGETPEYQRMHMARHIEISQLDRSEAHDLGVAYFDTGADYCAGVDAAFAYMLGQATGPDAGLAVN